MPLAAELELPSFDHTDATLRGPRYRRAMAELQKALAFLAERVSSLTLDGEPEFGTPSGIYGLERLPLKLERSS